MGLLRRGWPGAVGLLLGVLALGPALAPGFVLTYDMVFVPDPPATPAMFGLTGGFPRPVPSDAVVAGLAVVLPAQVVQKLVLLAIFVLAAWGAARLVPSDHPLPRLTAAVFYAWNPYVAERLLLGHWALLLGYAGLPWAVRAAVSVGEHGGAARLTRSLTPAAIGGFAAMNISALVVLCITATRPRLPRSTNQLHDHDRKRRSPGTHDHAGGRPSPGVRDNGGGRRFLGVIMHLVSRARRLHDHAGPRDRGIAPTLRAVLVIGGLSLPWLVPAVLQQFAAGHSAGASGTDPAGVDLFAARADTPFGAFGSLLSLGGIWNGEVVPPGLEAWPGAIARLALSLVGIAFFFHFVIMQFLSRPRRVHDHAGAYGQGAQRHERGGRRRSFPGVIMQLVRPSRKLRDHDGEWAWGLAVAAGVGLLLASLGITPPGRAVLRWLIEVWAGFAVLRDAQVWVAPLALVEAIGLALAVTALVRTAAAEPARSPAAPPHAALDTEHPPGSGGSGEGGAGSPAESGGLFGAGTSRRGEGLVLAGMVAVAPLVLLPTLAWGIGGRLEAVRYPGDWATARRIIERDPVPGAVLSLPWAAHRQPAWNAHRTTLDPLPRVLSRRVVWNDGLRVGGHALAAEDPVARRADALLLTQSDLTEPLRRAGYRYVVVARDENRFQIRLAGAQRVLSGTDLDLYRIPSPAKFVEVGAGSTGIILTGNLITLLLTLWSFGASGSNLMALRTR